MSPVSNVCYGGRLLRLELMLLLPVLLSLELKIMLKV